MSNTVIEAPPPTTTTAMQMPQLPSNMAWIDSGVLRAQQAQKIQQLFPYHYETIVEHLYQRDKQFGSAYQNSLIDMRHLHLWEVLLYLRKMLPFTQHIQTLQEQALAAMKPTGRGRPRKRQHSVVQDCPGRVPGNGLETTKRKEPEKSVERGSDESEDDDDDDDSDDDEDDEAAISSSDTANDGASGVDICDSPTLTQQQPVKPPPKKRYVQGEEPPKRLWRFQFPNSRKSHVNDAPMYYCVASLCFWPKGAKKLYEFASKRLQPYRPSLTEISEGHFHVLTETQASILAEKGYTGLAGRPGPKARIFVNTARVPNDILQEAQLEIEDVRLKRHDLQRQRYPEGKEAAMRKKESRKSQQGNCKEIEASELAATAEAVLMLATAGVPVVPVNTDATEKRDPTMQRSQSDGPSQMQTAQPQPSQPLEP